jgi:hypothetical protein
MSKKDLKKITNSFLDVRLVSLASWPAASKILPRDRNGPYVVTQQGYDPEDMKVTADEFVLGRSGRWLSLSYFFQMPVPERQAEFLFGTAAEVMQVMQDLPTAVKILRPGRGVSDAAANAEGDEMAAAFKAARDQAPGPAA